MRDELGMGKGILVVVSGPSGSGKTTLCRRLAAEEEGRVWYSVSCTTRPPRPGERDGVDYRFLGEEEFQRLLGAGELLEHARVHQRHSYGTLKGPVLERLRAGVDVVMDLDVQGAAQLRAATDPEIRGALVDVFILPPSVEELLVRVRARGPMAGEEEERRMKNAAAEMAQAGEYRHRIVSGEREEDFARFRAVVEEERRGGRCRSHEFKA